MTLQERRDVYKKVDALKEQDYNELLKDFNDFEILEDDVVSISCYNNMLEEFEVYEFVDDGNFLGLIERTKDLQYEKGGTWLLSIDRESDTFWVEFSEFRVEYDY